MWKRNWESTTKVKLSAAAKADLQETRRYISTVLSNPSASKQTLKRIATQLHTLEQFSEAGTPILIPGSPVAYRYLVCGSYMAFYHVHNEEVMVDRILYGRRDYHGKKTAHLLRKILRPEQLI